MIFIALLSPSCGDADEVDSAAIPSGLSDYQSEIFEDGVTEAEFERAVSDFNGCAIDAGADMQAVVTRSRIGEVGLELSYAETDFEIVDECYNEFVGDDMELAILYATVDPAAQAESRALHYKVLSQCYEENGFDRDQGSDDESFVAWVETQLNPQGQVATACREVLRRDVYGS